MQVGYSGYSYLLSLRHGLPAYSPRVQYAQLKDEMKHAPKAEESAVKLGLSSNHFRTKLERHLDDVSKGKGNLSQEVSKELSYKNSSNSTDLAKSDPKLLKDYMGYLSALRYDRRARFVTSVQETAHATKQIGNESDASKLSDFLLEVQKTVSDPNSE